METIKAEEISQIISEQIKSYEKKLDISETGIVLSVGDGIARVYGVQNAMAMELLEFPGGILGMVLNLEADNVGVAVLGEVTHIKEGDIVKRTGKIAQVPVGEGLLGRIIDATGAPLDGKGPIDTNEYRRIEIPGARGRPTDIISADAKLREKHVLNLDIQVIESTRVTETRRACRDKGAAGI